MAKTKTTKASKKATKAKASKSDKKKTVTTTKKKTRTKTAKKKTPDDEVKIDRRRKGRREEPIEADSQAEVLAGEEIEVESADIDSVDQEDSQSPLPARRKVQRRRQIDPTTCERDYTDDEIEFMHALDEYKRSSGRMFPTCSEILEVVRGIGYIKVDLATLEGNADSPEGEIAKGDETSLNAEGQLDESDTLEGASIDGLHGGDDTPLTESQPGSNVAVSEFGLENSLDDEPESFTGFESLQV